MTETAPTSDFIGLDDLLCFGLYSANNAMHRIYVPLLKDLNLTYPQYLVMVVLWEQDGLLVGELGAKLYLESNTLTPLLKRLESNGLLSRQRDSQDERQVRVQLTDAGLSLKEKARCIPEAIAGATGLSPEEIPQLTQELAALRQKLTVLRDTLVQNRA